MPRNVEAEAALLGALMIDNRLIDTIDELSAAHFYEPLHGRIFDAIAAAHRDGAAANPVTLRPMFERDASIDELGGVRYLAELTSSGAALIGARQFAKQIVDLAKLRALADAGRAITEAALDTAGEVNPAARIEQAEAMLATAVESGGEAAASISFASAIGMAARASRDVAEGRATLGVQVKGLPEWNDVVGGGLPAGDLIYLAGRPSMGKTALALRVARGAAAAGHGVLFISREMKVLPIGLRMLADMLFEAGSSASMDDIKKGRLTAADHRLVAEIEGYASTLPLEFEEPNTINAARIAGMIRRHKRSMARRGFSLDLVIVDYVGLLDPPTARGNREQEISDISRALKRAAMSTGVAMLALSQLSRAVEQREDKRPQLSDLRDSGSLEQDADAVLFVYRAQYYLERAEPRPGDKGRDQWELDMAAERDRIEIIGAKLRQGAIGSRKCHYFGSRQAVRPDDFFRTGGGL
ncbi:DnaB-like helicase C-terminal domain-containing protein [uncultured Sphingomonas sp.]|uniref:DnaB-like helicase C-terminal domain-containing protein n=1 Tax=uncultured Sphingomonas sp. TaxID=158754 RepID=UPI0025951A0C|nr:DnaB-like helicase C-terminal domain-containing protein [uncultured Sphingomonas sp.]